MSWLNIFQNINYNRGVCNIGVEETALDGDNLVDGE